MPDISELVIDGRIVSSSSSSPEDYAKAIERHSELAVKKPAFIIFPSSYEDVSKAVSFARDSSLQLAIKGGGTYTVPIATSDGGLVIDLSTLNKVTLSEDKSFVVAQGGCVLGDLYQEMAKHNLDIVGGSVWFVGLGGYMTSGGYSHLAGQKGMGVDNMLGATVVLANGEIVHTSETENPNLFWAIRGGMNQFGVVVEFEIKTHPATGPATVGLMAYPGTDLSRVLAALHEFLDKKTANESLILAFSRAPPHFYPGVAIMPWVSGDEQRGKQVLEPFRTLAKPVMDHTGLAPNFLAVSHGADVFLEHAPKRATYGSAIFTKLWDKLVADVFVKWMQFTEQNPDCNQTVIMWEFISTDKVATLPHDATAFNLREPHYYVVFAGRNRSPESDDVCKKWVTDTVNYVREQEQVLGGKRYGPIRGSALLSDTAEEVYGSSLPRLRKVKAAYDPHKLFNTGFVIEPDHT